MYPLGLGPEKVESLRGLMSPGEFSLLQGWLR
jgi:hypothetical protein